MNTDKPRLPTARAFTAEARRRGGAQWLFATGTLLDLAIGDVREGQERVFCDECANPGKGGHQETCGEKHEGREACHVLTAKRLHRPREHEELKDCPKGHQSGEREKEAMQGFDEKAKGAVAGVGAHRLQGGRRGLRRTARGGHTSRGGGGRAGCAQGIFVLHEKLRRFGAYGACDHGADVFRLKLEMVRTMGAGAFEEHKSILRFDDKGPSLGAAAKGQFCFGESLQKWKF